MQEPEQRRHNFGFMTPIVSNPVTEKHTSAAKAQKAADEEPITKLEIDKSRRKINFDDIEREMENGAQNDTE